MNYNIIAYGVYLLITIYVITIVGNTLYKNGRPFLVNCLHGNSSLADAINNILISGYYLVNIGYCVVTLKIWEKIISLQQLIEIESYKIGGIILLLGIMHLVNVTALLITKKKYKSPNFSNNLKNQ